MTSTSSSERLTSSERYFAVGFSLSGVNLESTFEKVWRERMKKVYERWRKIISEGESSFSPRVFSKMLKWRVREMKKYESGWMIGYL